MGSEIYDKHDASTGTGEEGGVVPDEPSSPEHPRRRSARADPEPNAVGAERRQSTQP